LRVREQVNPVAQLRPLKFRVAGQFRDIPLPAYVAEAIDKHIASHGTTPDGYLFQGRKRKLVIRRTYQEDFDRSAARAGLPPEFTPLSRPGARFRCCHRPVSPDRSPNPPYRSLGNGLSTLPAVRRGSQVARGRGSGCPGRRNG
jgi:hypothetical protein